MKTIHKLPKKFKRKINGAVYESDAIVIMPVIDQEGNIQYNTDPQIPVNTKNREQRRNRNTIRYADLSIDDKATSDAYKEMVARVVGAEVEARMADVAEIPESREP